MIIVLSILSLVIGTIMIFVIGGVITVNFVNTPQFKGADGKVLKGSIALFERVKLGGNSQAILIRGKNLDNPVILFLHAGPGLSETGMMRNMNSELEEHFTMVYLDQRGGGKSYSLFTDPASISTEQLLQDIHELTQYLKKKLNKEKIMIMGHSFGAGFGALAAATYPDDYSLFVGIGMPVKPGESDRLSYPWALEQARNDGNKKAVEQLEQVERYWELKEKKAYFQGMMVNKKWIGYYGGQIVGQKGFIPYVLKNSMCHEFTLFDYLPYYLGLNFVGPAAWNIMISTDLRKQAPQYQCPFILFTGSKDYNLVPDFTREYYNMVKAPLKKYYDFEKSAHFPHFEERELFQQIMIEQILPLVKTQPAG